MPFHDHTRRIVALILFFLLGPMLSASVLGLIVWRKSSWATAAHERELLRQTGLNLEIGHVEYERPGRTRYHNLTLRDAETGESVLECPDLLVAFVKTKNMDRFRPEETAPDSAKAASSAAANNDAGEEAPGGLIDFFAESFPLRKWSLRRPGTGYWKILSPNVQVRFDRLSPDVGGATIREFFMSLLAKRRGPDETPLDFAFDTVEVHPGGMDEHTPDAPASPVNDSPNPPYAGRYDGQDAAADPHGLHDLAGHVSGQYTLGRRSIELKNVRGRYYGTKDGANDAAERSTRLEVDCSLPYFGPGESVAFRAVRSRSGSVPSTHVSFSVPGKTSIPTPLLAVFMPQFAPLGKSGRFCGTIRADQSRSETTVTPISADRDWSITWENVTLSAIDLTHPQLAPHYTPYHVTGTVNGVRIDSAKFHGTLLEATGWVHIVQGTVEKQLMRRLISRFHLNVSPAHFVEEFPTDAIQFAACAFYFRLTPTGARILPALRFTDESERTLLMYSENGMQIHAQPNANPLSYAELLAALVRDDTPAIPLTPGTGKVMGLIQE